MLVFKSHIQKIVFALYKNWWDATKAVLKGKLQQLMYLLDKKKDLKSSLSFHLKKREKEQI